MNVTDETVPEEDLEEAEDAGVVEKRPRRKLFYIEAGKRGTLAKIMIGSILALVLFSLVINSYVQLNEVYSQISAAESTLNDLQSENVRMQTQLEDKLPFGILKNMRRIDWACKSWIVPRFNTSRFRRRMRLSSKNRIRTFLFRSNGNSTT